MWCVVCGVINFGVARRADTWEAGEWQKGGWRYMRVREDKKLANDISVIEKIQRSRADDIKQTEVLPPPSLSFVPSSPFLKCPHVTWTVCDSCWSCLPTKAPRRRRRHLRRHPQPTSTGPSLRLPPYTTDSDPRTPGSDDPPTDRSMAHRHVVAVVHHNTYHVCRASGASQGTPEQSPESSPLSSPAAPARTAPPLKRDRPEERSGDEEADGADGANDHQPDTASSSAKKQRIDFLLTGSSASSSSAADNNSNIADPYANFNFPGRE